MRDIQRGVTDKNLVKELKQLLNISIGSKLDINNAFFGPDTEKEVKIFQRLKGLDQDGVVSALTWGELWRDDKPVKIDATGYKKRVIEILLSQVGVKEKTGKNDSVEVEMYLKSTGLGKGYAWCQAFIFWGFEKASKEMFMSNPMPRTAGVLNCWNNSKAYQVPKGQKPKVGDVFTIDYGKGLGHTGLVIEVDGDYIITVEGNTNADMMTAKEDREGQGVYKRRRHINTINKGFLRYFD